jgi:putative PIN family toxin of toxin-antitoxin system
MNRRFIFDTNVIVSAGLRPQSQPNVALKKAQNLGTLLVSPNTWLELETVLSRPKFNRYITLEERQNFLLDFSQTVELILTDSFSTKECRDPKDNQYLELAVNGQAECLITGDQDLLILNPFRGISILSIWEFMEKIL